MGAPRNTCLAQRFLSLTRMTPAAAYPPTHGSNCACEFVSHVAFRLSPSHVFSLSLRWDAAREGRCDRLANVARE
eukprot:364513-Chlamydomonas_euryale.AAC.10